ncbi:hypothetical protein HPB50_019939 [Hyalomma asiaticum]|uniref:Uncharacterized protein n=1 Tax=Hyalomma asiaticum TaxID=266040 RepID=A0ACB7T098_HYAAI|nr:hypothetical protein HPB50_019939 [Hyalomma asiaticum]
MKPKTRHHNSSKASRAQENAASDSPSIYYTALDHLPTPVHEQHHDAARPPHATNRGQVRPQHGPGPWKAGAHPLKPGEAGKDAPNVSWCDQCVVVYLIMAMAFTVALAVIIIASSTRRQQEELTTMQRWAVPKKEKRSAQNSDEPARSRVVTEKRLQTTVFVVDYGVSVALNHSAAQGVTEKD